MKYNRLFSRIASLLLTCLLLCGTAFAAAPINTAQKCSLTVDYYDFSNVEFSVYRVASVSKTGTFSLAGDFTGAPVSLNGLSSSEWATVTNTLTAFADSHDLHPLQTGKTDTGGNVRFSDLQTGLYLVIGTQHISTDGWRYTPQPFLVTIPGRASDGGWSYDISAVPKYVREQLPPAGTTVDLKVLKGWDDAGHEQARPASITVYLLRNGDIYDTVTLSRADNWTCEWAGLDASFVWTVTEEPMAHYTLSIRKEGSTVILTNSYTDDPGPGPGPGPDPDDPNPPTPPTDPDDPIEVPLDPEDDPLSPGGGTEVPEDPLPMLPQTGMLWWPVPLMAGTGLLLLEVGYLLYRREI